jgi:hypothetical protein
MHLSINVKSPNNISKWQVGFNSAFKRLKNLTSVLKNTPLLSKGAQIRGLIFQQDKEETSFHLDVTAFLEVG